VIPASITHFGLHLGFSRTMNTGYQCLWNLLGRIHDDAPNVSVVRIMSDKVVRDLTERHKVEFGRRMQEMEERRFVLEDHLGLPLRHLLQ